MTEKKCPVDRGKLLIGLECCRIDVGECGECPYDHEKCTQSAADALAYIGWLEELVSIQEKQIRMLRVAIFEINDCATAALLTHARE